MATQTLQLGALLAVGLLALASATLMNAVVKDTTQAIEASLSLTDPEDVTVVARRQSAALHCHVTSTSSFNITWFLNGTQIPIGDGRWRPLPNGTLIVANEAAAGKRLNASLEGGYRCLVRNKDGGLISNAAELRISNFKDFLQQPRELSVVESDSVVIPCAVGSAQLMASVRWEFNEQPLPQSTRYVPVQSGLLITNTDFDDSGSYRCRVDSKSAKKKNKFSVSGNLTVMPRDRTLVSSPTMLPVNETNGNVTVLVGNDVTLYCVVNGWPKPTVRWLNDLNIVIGNSSILTLRNVTLKMSGRYTCSAHNSGNRITRLYRISVVQMPYFNKTPTSKSYQMAKSIRLDCQALGVPEPKIAWYKNGRPFHANGTLGRAQEQPNRLLISYSVSSDAGFYQCFATNSVGSVWTAALVKLNRSPKSPGLPSNVRCQSYNDTSVCLQWSAVPEVQAYSIHAYHSGLDLKEYVTNETYKLADNLHPDTNYTFSLRTYTNVANNELVHVSCKSGRTGSRNLKVLDYNAGSVKLSWDAISSDSTACGGDAPIFYKVLWKRTNQSSLHVQHVTGLHNILTDLLPGQTYDFQVHSVNDRDEKSDWIRFNLKNDTITGSKNDVDSTYSNETAVPTTPYQFDGVALTSHSVNLTWLDDNTGEIYYTVCYVAVAEDRDCEKGLLVKSVSKTLLLKGLKSNVAFEFKVRTHNADGMYSPFSYSVQITTLSDVPSAVQGLSYKIINRTTACVRWDPPLHRNGKLTEYLVKYTPNNSWPLEKWFHANIMVSLPRTSCWNSESKAISFLLRNLDPDKQYIVIVIAQNDAGLGNPTVPIVISTKNQVPETGGGEEEASGGSFDKQILGVILGLTISVSLVVVAALSALGVRWYLRRRKSARAPAINNGNSRIRKQENCNVDVHELQQLVGGNNGTTHIPISPPSYLDTKGGAEYPNNLSNGGPRKTYFNGNHLSGNQVHITENPQFTAPNINHTKLRIFKDPTNRAATESYTEDSNSNLQKFSISKLLGAKTNGGTESPQLETDIQHRIDDVSFIDDLNSTQLTSLDDSSSTVSDLARRPNG